MSDASAISPRRGYPDEMMKKMVFLTHHASLITHHFPKVVVIQVYDFYRRRRCFVPFVVLFGAGARGRLIDIVSGDHSEQQGHAGLQTRIGDAVRGGRGDKIKVRSVTANDHAQANHRVELSGFCSL